MRCLLRQLTVVNLGHLTIDKLSDDVLLRIFDSYRRGYDDENVYGGGMCYYTNAKDGGISS